jgi:hypothetical protein
MGNSFSPCIVERLSSALYAPPFDPSKSPYLRVGLIGGDIPIFPPLAMLLFSGISCLGWFVSGNRLPYLSAITAQFGSEVEVDSTMSIAVRLGIAGSMLTWARKRKEECRDALRKAETIANFGTVKKIADSGPFAYCRNMMYVALVSVPLAASVALDSLWLGLSAVTLWIYLHFSVVPAEEKFLLEQFGEEYKKYCKLVPRWFF